MIRVRSKNVLLVSPNVVPLELLPKNKSFRHVSSPANIFPAIHELKPNLIIFDYEYLSHDFEKILRRITCNAFYQHIKICCYKAKPHTKVDELLRVLGVDYIFYEEDMRETPATKNIFDTLSATVNIPVFNWLAKPAH